MPQIIIPGDKLPVSQETLDSQKVSVGPFINISSSNELSISNAGIFTHKIKKNKQLISLETSSRNYIPSVGDFVIGTIEGTFSECFRVSLSPYKHSALLPYMAFESATKKNRPNLKNGALVYAKVTAYDPYLDVELECFNSTTGKSEGFGELTGGNVVKVDLAFARYLIFNQANEILSHLAEICQFEIAIGVNGLIWIKASDCLLTLGCSRYLEKASSVSSSGLKSLAQACFNIS